MKEYVIQTTLRYPLHVKAAAALVRTASNFVNDFQLISVKEDKTIVVDAKSILGVISLALDSGDKVEIRFMGDENSNNIIEDLLRALGSDI